MRRRDVGEAVAHVARPRRRVLDAHVDAGDLLHHARKLVDRDAAAAADVEHAADARREGDREIGGGDVGHVHEIAGLLAVAEDRHRHAPCRIRSAKIGITLP